MILIGGMIIIHSPAPPQVEAAQFTKAGAFAPRTATPAAPRLSGQEIVITFAQAKGLATSCEAISDSPYVWHQRAIIHTAPIAALKSKGLLVSYPDSNDLFQPTPLGRSVYAGIDYGPGATWPQTVFVADDG